MRKNFLMVATCALMLLFSSPVSQAQKKTVVDDEKAPTYEIGGQIFSFQSHDLGFGWGAGSRFTYNLNNYIAFDSEVNFFLPDEGPAYATQGLFGIKAGKRTRHFGIFAKVRPGFQNEPSLDRPRAGEVSAGRGRSCRILPRPACSPAVRCGRRDHPFWKHCGGSGLVCAASGNHPQFSVKLGCRRQILKSPPQT